MTFDIREKVAHEEVRCGQGRCALGVVWWCSEAIGAVPDSTHTYANAVPARMSQLGRGYST